MSHERRLDDQAGKAHKPPEQDRQEQRPGGREKDSAGLTSLQRLVGNRAVQRRLEAELRVGDSAFNESAVQRSELDADEVRGQYLGEFVSAFDACCPRLGRTQSRISKCRCL